MKNLLYILGLSLIPSFQNQVKPDSRTFYIIDYETAINNKKIVKLSQIASNVEYIQLETNKDCLLNAEARFFFIEDSLIFISNNDHILKFDITGKFLKKIGNPGRGPGELTQISEISILPKKRQIAVQLLGKRSLIFFTFDGEYLKTESIPFKGIIKKMDDGKILIWDRGPLKYAKQTYLLISDNGDRISVIPNYKPDFNVSPISIARSYSFCPEYFYFINKKLLFKDEYNDTIYSIVSNKIVPSFMIKMGKYKLPIKLYPENLHPGDMDNFIKEAQNYYFCYPFETSNQVFVASYSYSKEIPKLILYNKTERKGNLLINREGSSTGFSNDWDNGQDFWPIGSVTSKKVFMPLNVYKIQTALESNIKNNVDAEYPEKQKKLETMINESDVYNNPIIMLVTLK